ncbi:MAG: homocysteine S-methyltransferase family protein [Verrucomicrobiota bacterium]|jgi:5-methyltetrahydrofolate--homocysteine methyltransferase
MHPVIKELLAAGSVVTDGAWGTQLQARGLPIGACPDEWNLTQPGKVEEVAAAYVAAGSRIILTNTFGANRIRLAEFNLVDKVAEINRSGAAISKKAAGKKALVFASVGPTGKMLVAGDVTEAELRTAFTEQAQALKDGGADALVIETMAELEEAQIALDAAKSTGLPVVVCMTFDTGGRTMMGVAPDQAAKQFTAAGADVIGSNCGNGIGAFIPICQELRAATALPIWIKANAGQPEYADGKVVYRITPEEFAGHAPALRDAGANFIGGCCGTTPDHLRTVISILSRP